MAKSKPVEEELSFDDLKAVPGDQTDQMFSETPVYDTQWEEKSQAVTDANSPDKWHRAISQRSYAAGPVYVKPGKEVPEILQALVEASLEDYFRDDMPHPQTIPFDAEEDAKEFVILVKSYAATRGNGEAKISVRAHTVKNQPCVVKFYATPLKTRAKRKTAE